MINYRNKSIVTMLSVYFIGMALCVLLGFIIPIDNLIYKAVILDIIATIFIFIVSIIFNNSSIYDPYWSIAPIPILFYWVYSSGSAEHETGFRNYIIIGLVILWSIRLTMNFFRRWEGIKHEDWRYVSFRDKPRLVYWFISFFGFHLFPTLIVFFGCLALYPAISIKGNTLEIIDLVAIAVTLAAITMEAISDQQLRMFSKTNTNKENFIKTGLWKYSRHPNYFGEVLFWVGLSMFSMNVSVFKWYVLIGPLLIVLMFRYISIPMLEKKVKQYKKGYSEYASKTSIIIPFPPNK